MSDTESTPTMSYRRLGNTGLKVSELCLGTMTFSMGSDTNSWGLPTTDKDSAHEMMSFFASKGGNFFDTADVYGPGTSEECVGEWLAAQPTDNFVVATKVFGTVGSGPNDGGLSAYHIHRGARESLKRLGRDTIELYQAHKFDKNTPLEETLVAFDDLVRQGHVRYIGLSNWYAHNIVEAILLSKQLGLHIPFAAIQPQYNLLCRQIERDILPVAEQYGLGVMPWSPLKGGWLTGKYSRESEGPGEGSRVAWAENAGWSETAWTVLANEHTWGIIDALNQVSGEHGVSPSAVALRWIMQHSSAPIPIVGAKKMSHLVDNLNATTIELTDEQMTLLNDASKLEPMYPWCLY